MQASACRPESSYLIDYPLRNSLNLILFKKEYFIVFHCLIAPTLLLTLPDVQEEELSNEN